MEIRGGDEGLGEEASPPQAVKRHGAENRDQLFGEPRLSKAAGSGEGVARRHSGGTSGACNTETTLGWVLGTSHPTAFSEMSRVLQHHTPRLRVGLLCEVN